MKKTTKEKSKLLKKLHERKLEKAEAGEIIEKNGNTKL